MKIKAYILVIVFGLAILAGCARDERYLVEPPPPPPPPPRYQKVYKMDVNTSTTYATDVDILWVVDNSGSMEKYQKLVIRNSGEFIREFTRNSQLNWRLGMISTSEGEPPYLGFDSVVDWQSSDPMGEFNAAVARLGISGHDKEKTFKTVESVLTKYPHFLRPGAYFILIVVSDEYEQTFGSVDAFIANQVRRVGGDAGKFAAFGVYLPDHLYPYGNQDYKDLVKKTGGKTYDLSSSNFGGLLAQLGQDLAARTSMINPEIMLDQIPKIETIRVTYKGRNLRAGSAAVGGEWTYDPSYNVIRIANPKIIDGNRLDVTVSFEVREKNPKP